MKSLLIDNDRESRFERRENGALSFAEYRRGPDRIILVDFHVAPQARGTGADSRLMEAIVQEARRRRLHIEARHPWPAQWLDGRPEYADLVVEPQIPQDGSDGDAFRPPEQLA
jgi:predicted GNAT family acetyltransferase